MITPLLKDILKVLDGVAPFSIAEEWDNSGFQVGFLSEKITKVLISLDPTIEALRSARDRNAQLLLTHHPLIFNRLSNINPDVYPGDVISEALTSRVSIVAVHTNLDMAIGGINDILARMIGLQNVGALVKKDNSFDVLDGLGRIGDLPETISLSEVAGIVMDALGATGLMVMGPPDKKIKKVALLGGSGGEEVGRAVEQGADLYITGDIKHNEALLAQGVGLALIDGGHFNLENAAMHLFANILRDKFKDLGWDLIVETYKDEKAPMRYLCRKDVN
jgi:GTP cyclohydrolase I